MFNRYRIIEATSLADLAELVSSLMRAGWTPCGGVGAYQVNNGDYLFVQGLIHSLGDESEVEDYLVDGINADNDNKGDQ